MGYYSDPTASQALGSINREFSKREKRAKALCERYLKGTLSDEAFEAAHAQFTGIYQHVLDHALAKALQERSQSENQSA